MSGMTDKIAIDLTWVRVGKVGGTESFIRNLLNGIQQCTGYKIEVYLILAKDNYNSFTDYRDKKSFHLIKCNVQSSSQIQRIIWQNLFLGRLLKKYRITKCLEPIYITPFFNPFRIKFYVVIHDLQALHYPRYSGNIRVLWMKMSWRHTINLAKKIISISEYVYNDINAHYKKAKPKNCVIYNPIVYEKEKQSNAIFEKLSIHKGDYYYSVGNTFPHKNIITLIKMMGIIKKEYRGLLYPLVISGIQYDHRNEISDKRAKSENQIWSLIKEKDLESYIIFSGYVSNEERNSLYSNCRFFLFPSVFEGFGMPPVEAMLANRPVITTRNASLYEVTGGLVNYVEDPYNPREYIQLMINTPSVPSTESINALIKRYEPKYVGSQYIRMLTGKN